LLDYGVNLQGCELCHVAEGERGKETNAVITEVSVEETHTNTQQIQFHTLRTKSTTYLHNPGQFTLRKYISQTFILVKMA